MNTKAESQHKITIEKLFRGHLSAHFTYIFPSLKYGWEGPKQNNRNQTTKVKNVKQCDKEIMKNNNVLFFLKECTSNFLFPVISKRAENRHSLEKKSPYYCLSGTSVREDRNRDIYIHTEKVCWARCFNFSRKLLNSIFFKI